MGGDGRVTALQRMSTVRGRDLRERLGVHSQVIGCCVGVGVARRSLIASSSPVRPTRRNTSSWWRTAALSQITARPSPTITACGYTPTVCGDPQNPSTTCRIHLGSVFYGESCGFRNCRFLLQDYTPTAGQASRSLRITEACITVSGPLPPWRSSLGRRRRRRHRKIPRHAAGTAARPCES
jgi:hypothetical protein